MARFGIISAIAIGGAAGAVARYLISRAVQQSVVSTFPYGTLAANLIGCLLLGFCFIWLQRVSPAWRMGVTVGFIGALTTFSTYCLESVNLLDARQTYAAMANLAGSVVLGLAATFAGMVLAKMIFGS